MIFTILRSKTFVWLIFFLIRDFFLLMRQRLEFVYFRFGLLKLSGAVRIGPREES